MNLSVDSSGVALVAVTSPADIAGWAVRATVVSPELLEFEALPGVGGVAELIIPPSFKGRRYRIEIVDPAEGAHFVNEGVLELVNPASVDYYTWTPAAAPPAAFVPYTHVQDVASASWIIPHGLGRHPSVTVVDSGDTTIEGHPSYGDENTVVINFVAPTSGKAYLN